jgi:ferredoxin
MAAAAVQRLLLLLTALLVVQAAPCVHCDVCVSVCVWELACF